MIAEKESRYVTLMRERYEKEHMSYDEENIFLFLINGPEQYHNEDKMLKFIQNHPNATMNEVWDYFDEITPHGYPPGTTEEDFWNDED